MIYSPGQARVLFSVWPPQTEQFIVGGTADANEAQTIKAQYRDVECIGFEPNKVMREEQLKLDFPGKLYPYALWNSNTNLELLSPNDRHISSSVCRDLSHCDNSSQTVEAKTLDSLSEEVGPFSNCVLWLDIEHAEYQALQGAEELLKSGKILLINTEIMGKENDRNVTEFLHKFNFRIVKVWNNHVMPGLKDVIFRLN